MKMKKMARLTWAAVVGFIILVALLIATDVKSQAATKQNATWEELSAAVTRVAMTGKAQDYTSDTGYLVMVDESKYTCGVFTWDSEKNLWMITKSIPVSIGKPSTPTPCKEFKIVDKWEHFDLNGYRFWYCSWMGGIGVHSTAYDIADTPEVEKDGRINAQASNGCVRMSLSASKWIYDNVPVGTTVVIYDSAY